MRTFYAPFENEPMAAQRTQVIEEMKEPCLKGGIYAARATPYIYYLALCYVLSPDDVQTTCRKGCSHGVCKEKAQRAFACACVL